MKLTEFLAFAPGGEDCLVYTKDINGAASFTNVAEINKRVREEAQFSTAGFQSYVITGFFEDWGVSDNLRVTGKAIFDNLCPEDVSMSNIEDTLKEWYTLVDLILYKTPLMIKKHFKVTKKKGQVKPDILGNIKPSQREIERIKNEAFERGRGGSVILRNKLAEYVDGETLGEIVSASKENSQNLKEAIKFITNELSREKLLQDDLTDSGLWVSAARQFNMEEGSYYHIAPPTF